MVLMMLENVNPKFISILRKKVIRTFVWAAVFYYVRDVTKLHSNVQLKKFLSIGWPFASLDSYLFDDEVKSRS